MIFSFAFLSNCTQPIADNALKEDPIADTRMVQACEPSTSEICQKTDVVDQLHSWSSGNTCKLLYSYTKKECPSGGIYIYNVSYKWPTPLPGACANLKNTYDQSTPEAKLKWDRLFLAGGIVNIESFTLNNINKSKYACYDNANFHITSMMASCLQRCTDLTNPNQCGDGCCTRITYFCAMPDGSIKKTIQNGNLPVCQNIQNCSGLSTPCQTSCKELYDLGNLE